MTLSTAATQEIDQWLLSHFKPNEPGISAIVVQDGKTLYRAGYGAANVELDVPIRPEMVFRIGSITKQFTAAAILMLMERGKLALTDRLTKFLSRYPTQGHKITLAHLLTHTSGIKSYTDMPESVKISREDRTLAEMMDFFKDQPMDFAPGERWQYCNSGYLLLGAVIEKVSGLSYEAFLQKNIFDKLGMADTHYDMPNKMIRGRVAGYSNGAAGIENSMYISMTQPHAAGALVSSVDDLAKWDAALYGSKLLKQSTLKQAWTSHILKNDKDTLYGYGWNILRSDDLTLVEHGGGIPGFSTFALRVPQHKLFVAVLANTNNPALEPIYVAWQLALRTMGQPHGEPNSFAISKKDLAKLVGKYKVNELFDIAFRQKKNTLFVEFGAGSPLVEICAMGQHEFFVKDSFLRFRFVAGDDSNVTAVKIFDRGVLRDTALRSA